MRLIDADALVEKFWQEECRTQTRRDFVAMVNYAPTVDAVPVVHGFWIKYPTQYTEITSNGECRKDTIELVKCSVCGAPRLYCSNLNYCENCGAKMDGGVDDG